MAGNFAADADLRPVSVLEVGFDRRLWRSSANEVGCRARTKEKADRLDKNRLAGACLAGQDDEPGLEVDFDSLDHRQVADAE